MKTVRVLQGHSVAFNGVWFNQGDQLDVPDAQEFKVTRPKYDEAGKYLGDEEVSQVETLSDAAPAPKSSKHKKEEG